MTLRNWRLVLRDQLPWSRLWLNIRNGNIKGLISKRSHFTQAGTPKVTYNSKATAVKAADQMARKKGVYFSNYKCIHCHGYHIGKNSHGRVD